MDNGAVLFLLNLAITVFCYVVVPFFIAKWILKKPLSRKKRLSLVIINGVIFYFVSCTIPLVFGAEFPIFNAAPALLWSTVVNYILKNKFPEEESDVSKKDIFLDDTPSPFQEEYTGNSPFASEEKNEKKPYKIAAICAVVLFLGTSVLSLVLGYQLHLSRQEITTLSQNYEKTKSKLEETTFALEKTKLDYKTYVHASKPLIDEAAFYHFSSCVILADDPDDGTYHIFNGCTRALFLDSYYILNVEGAKSVGYSPCKDCFPEGSNGYGDLEDFIKIKELAGGYY